ncbi:MAG: 50S ribosomal protein L28 [Alphaproteobacteria bacterium]|nr:50S ribosomal protein L28 [Alphaproteobacteria bacterium]
MARRCALTGKRPISGNNVSKANNRTRRRFLPNVQTATVLSETLGRPVRLKLSAGAIRTIEHNGGLDAYLLKTADANLAPEARRLKREIKKAQTPAG